MLSLNIPQVRFIAAVYAVTKRSITQACVVIISLPSWQPRSRARGREVWQALAAPPLWGLATLALSLAPRSTRGSPGGLCGPKTSATPSDASQLKRSSQSLVFMSRERGLKEEWPEIQRTGEHGAMRSLGPERLFVDLLLHAEMEKAAVVGRSYPWRNKWG